MSSVSYGRHTDFQQTLISEGDEPSQSFVVSQGLSSAKVSKSVQQKLEKSILFNNRNENYAWLSNLYEHPLVLKNVTYKSVEHAFQCQKHVRDSATQRMIMESDALAAKVIGKCIKLNDVEKAIWCKDRVNRMLECLIAKFEDHELLRLLKSTSGLTLCEDTEDLFWGYASGIGQNKLGELLESVRGQAVYSENEIRDRNFYVSKYSRQYSIEFGIILRREWHHIVDPIKGEWSFSYSKIEKKRTPGYFAARHHKCTKCKQIVLGLYGNYKSLNRMCLSCMGYAVPFWYFLNSVGVKQYIERPDHVIGWRHRAEMKYSAEFSDVVFYNWFHIIDYNKGLWSPEWLIDDTMMIPGGRNIDDHKCSVCHEYCLGVPFCCYTFERTCLRCKGYKVPDYYSTPAFFFPPKLRNQFILMPSQDAPKKTFEHIKKWEHLKVGTYEEGKFPQKFKEIEYYKYNEIPSTHHVYHHSAKMNPANFHSKARNIDTFVQKAAAELMPGLLHESLNWQFKEPNMNSIYNSVAKFDIDPEFEFDTKAGTFADLFVRELFVPIMSLHCDKQEKILNTKANEWQDFLTDPDMKLDWDTSSGYYGKYEPLYGYSEQEKNNILSKADNVNDYLGEMEVRDKKVWDKMRRRKHEDWKAACLRADRIIENEGFDKNDSPWIVYVKPKETHVTTKQENLKCRTIFCPDFSTILLSELFFHTQNKAIYQQHSLTCIGPGSTWFHNGAEELMKYFKAYPSGSGLFRYFDFSSWDGHCRRRQSKQIAAIRFYAIRWHRIKEAKKWKKIFWNLYEHNWDNQLMLPLGIMMSKPHGQSSGFVNTTPDNTMMNAWLFAYAFAFCYLYSTEKRLNKLLKHHNFGLNVLRTYETFKFLYTQGFFAKFYGDDQLERVMSKALNKFYTVHECKRILTVHAGMTIKVSAFGEGEHISKVEYLSSKIKISNNGTLVKWRDGLNSLIRLLWGSYCSQPSELIDRNYARLIGHYYDNFFNLPIRKLIEHVEKLYANHYNFVLNRKPNPLFDARDMKRFADILKQVGLIEVFPSRQKVLENYGLKHDCWVDELTEKKLTIPKHLKSFNKNVIVESFSIINARILDPPSFNMGKAVLNPPIIALNPLKHVKTKDRFKYRCAAFRFLKEYSGNAGMKMLECISMLCMEKVNNMIDYGSHPGSSLNTVALHFEQVYCLAVSLNPDASTRVFNYKLQRRGDYFPGTLNEYVCSYENTVNFGHYQFVYSDMADLDDMTADEHYDKFVESLLIEFLHNSTRYLVVKFRGMPARWGKNYSYRKRVQDSVITAVSADRYYLFCMLYLGCKTCRFVKPTYSYAHNTEFFILCEKISTISIYPSARYLSKFVDNFRCFENELNSYINDGRRAMDVFTSSWFASKRDKSKKTLYPSSNPAHGDLKFQRRLFEKIGPAIQVTCASTITPTGNLATPLCYPVQLPNVNNFELESLNVDLFRRTVFVCGGYGTIVFSTLYYHYIITSDHQDKAKNKEILSRDMKHSYGQWRAKTPIGQAWLLIVDREESTDKNFYSSCFSEYNAKLIVDMVTADGYYPIKTSHIEHETLYYKLWTSTPGNSGGGLFQNSRIVATHNGCTKTFKYGIGNLLAGFDKHIRHFISISSRRELSPMKGHGMIMNDGELRLFNMAPNVPKRPEKFIFGAKHGSDEVGNELKLTRDKPGMTEKELDELWEKKFGHKYLWTGNLSSGKAVPKIC